jgi:DNA (cytosine-5)-methyltransferase 1
VCFFENVEGHISLGLSSVISDLEELGYKMSWGIFSAREVGAPHQRKRVFILAHDQRQRVEELGWQIAGASQFNSAWNDGGDAILAYTKDQYGRHTIGPEAQDTKSALRCQYLWPSRPGEPQHGWEPPRVVGNTKKLFSDGCNNITGSGGEHRETLPKQSGNTDGDKSGSGSGNQAQPPLGGNPDGTSNWMDYAQLQISCDNRTDELRLLGNGVVPATAERAFRTLIKELL